MLKRIDTRWGMLLLAMLLQLPLILNPGYFSHDELQWASWSYLREFGQIDWLSPLDFGMFQYRPLTFNFWMLLNYLFFGHPYLMHAIQALFGALTLLLLRELMAHYGITGLRRLLACVLWLCFPFVLYVHGWVGTFADQIWLSAGLLGLLAVFRMDLSAAPVRPLLAGAAATLIGLLAKEAALVVPAFLLAHALLLPVRRRLFLWAMLGGGLMAVLYLALRLKIILAGAEQSSDYRPTWIEAPTRMLEYWLFPATLQRLEPYGILGDYSSRIGWSCAGLALLALGLAWKRWRHLLLLLVLPAMALGPTLVLGYPAAQYAYGFSTVVIVLLAHASIGLGKRWLAFSALWFALTLIHSLNLMHLFREVGHMQSVLLPQVNALVQADPTSPIRVRAVHIDDEWRVRRTLFDIKAYHGVPWSNRVSWVATDDPEQQATHDMQRNGQLTPAQR